MNLTSSRNNYFHETIIKNIINGHGVLLVNTFNAINFADSLRDYEDLFKISKNKYFQEYSYYLVNGGHKYTRQMVFWYKNF